MTSVTKFVEVHNSYTIPQKQFNLHRNKCFSLYCSKRYTISLQQKKGEEDCVKKYLHQINTLKRNHKSIHYLLLYGKRLPVENRFFSNFGNCLQILRLQLFATNSTTLIMSLSKYRVVARKPENL